MLYVSDALIDLESYGQLKELISGLTALRHLACWAVADFSANDSTLARLLFLMRAVSMPATIHTIFVDLPFNLGSDARLDTLDENLVLLRNDASTILARYSSLRVFTIKIYVRNHSWVASKAFEEMFVRNIPLLKNKLVVEGNQDVVVINTVY